jgi:hypothetical protein
MWNLTPELLGNFAIGFLVIVAAVGSYINSLRKAVPNPLVAGVGGGLVDRDQMERLIQAVNRVADALTDKNTASINDKLDDLLEQVNQASNRKPGVRRPSS